MKHKSTSHLLILSLVFLATLFTFSCTSNWSQFRGPDNNMVVKAKNLPDQWGEDLNIRWTADIDGDGWSSPVVWDDKIFLTSAVTVQINTPPEPEEGDEDEAVVDPGDLDDVYRWEVSCLDLATGAELWKKIAFEGSPRIKKHRAHNFAAETPVTDGNRLYVYFGMTGLYCYDLDGNLLWEKDLGAFKTQRDWGTGTSPLLYKGLLYMQVDNEEASFLTALDAGSGEEVWKVDRDEKTNYSTPYMWKNSTRTELVVGGLKARSYDPLTGEVLWELGMKGHYNIPSAVGDMDHLYIGNPGFRDTPATLFAVKAGASGDITPAEGEITSEGVTWSNQDAPLANPSPLLYNGLLYTVSSRGGEVTCLDPATGEQVYQEKLEGVGACWASPWAYQDKIFFLDDKGATRVFSAGQTFELLHENNLDDQFWSSVAVGGDAWLLKGTQKLYCIGL